MPPNRTPTSHRTTFDLPPDGRVSFPVPPGSTPDIRITFFAGTTRTTGIHWHETHTELLRIVQGAACLERDGVVEVVTEREGVVRIERGVRHGYWRAGRGMGEGEGVGGKDEGEERVRLAVRGVPKEVLDADLVLVESTEPVDGDKEVFFRHVLSILGEERPPGMMGVGWMLWSLFVVFAAHDNYPVVVGVTRRFGERVGKGLEWVITCAVLNVAAFFGGFVGLKATYEEYTPVELRDRGAEERVIREIGTGREVEGEEGKKLS